MATSSGLPRESLRLRPGESSEALTAVPLALLARRPRQSGPLAPEPAAGLDGDA